MNTSFFSGTTGYFGLILRISCPSPRICHLSKEPVGLLLSFDGQDQGSLSSGAPFSPTLMDYAPDYRPQDLPTLAGGNTNYSLSCRTSEIARSVPVLWFFPQLLVASLHQVLSSTHLRTEGKSSADPPELALPPGLCLVNSNCLGL